MGGFRTLSDDSDQMVGLSRIDGWSSNSHGAVIVDENASAVISANRRTHHVSAVERPGATIASGLGRVAALVARGFRFACLTLVTQRGNALRGNAHCEKILAHDQSLSIRGQYPAA